MTDLTQSAFDGSSAVSAERESEDRHSFSYCLHFVGFFVLG